MQASTPGRAQTVRYMMWVERVFGALAEANAASPLTGGVSLTAVAELLHLGSIEPDDLGRHGEPGEALMTAMYDLDALGLVTFQNVAHGNSLTRDGRDMATLGFGKLRDAAAGIPLSEDERVVLAKVYLGSMLEGDGWADLRLVDAGSMAAELVGGTRYEDQLRLRTILGDLRGKGLLRNHHTSSRPTYLAAVILGEGDPRSSGARAGLIDWSVPMPGWEGIESRLSELKVSLAAAMSDEDLKAVNLRCRELAADAMALVFDTSMVPDDVAPPSPQDAEGMLEHYLRVTVQGKDLQELRAFLRKSLALANAGTHSSAKARAFTVAAAQGMLAFIRAIQSFERSRGSAAQDSE